MQSLHSSPPDQFEAPAHVSSGTGQIGVRDIINGVELVVAVVECDNRGSACSACSTLDISKEGRKHQDCNVDVLIV